MAARAAAWVAAALLAVRWQVDPDLWGHLRFGLDMIRDGEVARADPYSFTSDIPWTNHEWLSEAVLAMAYSAGGVVGVIVLKVAILGVAYGTIAWTLRNVAPPARWLLLAVAVISTAPIAMTMRPQLWSILLLTLWAATTFRTPRWQTPLSIAIFALWANVHGGWVVGIGVLCAWLAGTVVDRREWRVVMTGGIMCATALAATLLTPYHIDLWRFILRTVRMERAIIEWRPVWQQSTPSDLALWIIVTATALILVLRVRWSWAAVLPVCMLAVGSFQVSRMVGLFGIATVMFLGPRWQWGGGPPFPRRLIAMLAVAALLPSLMIAVKQTRCVEIAGPHTPDLEAAGALASSDVEGRLMVPFDWGQYAIWHFSPRLRVSLDGRRETVYSESVLEEQHAFDRGDPRILRFIDDQRPEYVWLPRSHERLTELLEDGGYRPDVTTAASTVLTRADLPALTHAPAMPACFP